MDISAILKTIADRSNLLFGAVVAGLAFWIADLRGAVPAEVSRAWLYPIYWIGLVSAAALAFGVAASLRKRIGTSSRARRDEVRRAEQALRNFQILLPEHRAALVFIKAHEAKRFPVPHSFRMLNEMHDLGLLNREPSLSLYTDTTYYSVPEPIWAEMQRMGWPTGQPIPPYPPWAEGHVRI